jgi:hypothetical protein
MTPSRRLPAILFVLAAGAAWAQQPAIVQLHHRSAESLMTVLRPLVAPAILTGSGMQLQVRASPSDLSRVMRLVEHSDRPLQPLAVAFSDEPPATQDVKEEAKPPPGGGSVTLSTGRTMPPDSYGNGQIVSTQPARRSATVLEGEPLRISMPAAQALWFRAHGSRSKAPSTGADGNASVAPGAEGVVHFDAVSDFTARIWLADATVAIELQPLAAGAIDAGTDRGPDRATVYGRVGQWIALVDSGTDLQMPAGGSGVPRTGLWIKVDARPGSAVEAH